MVPPLARDIPYPQLGEASWTSSLEEASLVVLVSPPLPPIDLEDVGGLQNDVRSGAAGGADAIVAG